MCSSNRGVTVPSLSPCIRCTAPSAGRLWRRLWNLGGATISKSLRSALPFLLQCGRGWRLLQIHSAPLRFNFLRLFDLIHLLVFPYRLDSLGEEGQLNNQMPWAQMSIEICVSDTVVETAFDEYCLERSVHEFRCSVIPDYMISREH